jgi:hypothetical protein
MKGRTYDNDFANGEAKEFLATCMQCENTLKAGSADIVAEAMDTHTELTGHYDIKVEEF